MTNCPSGEEMCAEPVKQLVDEWGYTFVVPGGEMRWDPLPTSFNIFIGLLFISFGVAGMIACGTVIRILLKFSKQMLDPSGIVLFNFMLANLGMTSLQSPFSGISSLFERWIFGDFGCQLYSVLGFFFGNSIILGIFLILLDFYVLAFPIHIRHLSSSQRANYYFVMIFIQWMVSLVLASLPLFGIMARYGPEPSGTMCTIDYWHGNFNNYNGYLLLLTVVSYIIPIGFAWYALSKASALYKKMDRKGSSHSKLEVKHFAGMTKYCCTIIWVQLVFWMPFVFVCIWPMFFPPTTFNVFYTVSAPLFAKMTPFLNAVAAIKYIPRINEGYHNLDKANDSHFQIPDQIKTPISPINLEKSE